MRYSKMNYKCIILNVDEEEVVIKIKDISIYCFCNIGTLLSKGDKATVNLDLYDIQITEINDKIGIYRKGNTYAYDIIGILDINNSILKSCINFPIDREELYDYGYLDGKVIKASVLRINVEFI